MTTETLRIDGPTVRRWMPHAYPFTLLDAVEVYDPKRRFLIGLKQISQNEPFLQGHFPDYPILPGVIAIEALSQASGMLMNLDSAFSAGVPLGELLGSRSEPGRGFLAESRIKHMAGIYPGDRMLMETEVVQNRGDLYVFKVRALVEGREVTKGQLTMARTLGALT